MKTLKITLLFCATLLCFASCSNEDDAVVTETESRFLDDIRPRYFKALDFYSEANVNELADFFQDFQTVFKEVEKEYNDGIYTTSEDLNNLNLLYNYYSFFILAIVRAELDGLIELDDIIGNRTNLFSSTPKDSPHFRRDELRAMMERAESVSFTSVYINGYNDKTYGFYLAIRQLQERVKNDGMNDRATQDEMINYSLDRIDDYEIFYLWNVLMSQLTFNNYNDPLNTFENPSMEKILDVFNSKIVPGAFVGTINNYAPFLGPLYRVDMSMKKIHGIMEAGDPMDDDYIESIRIYMNVLDVIGDRIETQDAETLNAWSDKETFYDRKEQIDAIRTYYSEVSDGNLDYPKPNLGELFVSEGFNKAYQCYSCHKPLEL